MACSGRTQRREPSPQRMDFGQGKAADGLIHRLGDDFGGGAAGLVPVASAVLALAEHRGLPGRAVVDATVLGIDVACRIGNAIYPDHYDRGWHITGTTGVFGAAAAVRADAARRAADAWRSASPRRSLGPARTVRHHDQALPSGRRGARRPIAALLASKGFNASRARARGAARPGQRGLGQARWNEVTDELGERWEISFNSYKPFACGIVIHPSIDACVRLRAQGVKAEDVEKIELRVHPLVLELTGKKEPKDGLQGKFSVYHGCAVGLIYGRAGEDEYADAVVTDPKVIALRDKVQATVDATIDEDAARVTARCATAGASTCMSSTRSARCRTRCRTRSSRRSSTRWSCRSSARRAPAEITAAAARSPRSPDVRALIRRSAAER